jgi:hypothetical protein
MASSTSHSESGVPRLTLALIAIALLTWACCAAYTLWLNPENKFLTAAARVKQTWARKMTREYGTKYLVFGGSSCMFSVDGERLLERHQLPLVNMGLFAVCGAKTLTEWALTEVNSGDTLVVAIEPGLLTEDIRPTAAAIQFCYSMQSPHWIRGLLEPGASLDPGSLLALRPGGHHVCIMIGKLIGRRPLFRYALREIHPSGWVETQVRQNDWPAPGHGKGLSPSLRTLFQSLNDWCRTNQVRVCYSLPMAWCTPELLPEFQRKNASLLLEVSELIPVLEDRQLGAYTNVELYADTAWHLNADGIALRSDELAAQLRAWRMWNPEELRFISTNSLAASSK